MLRIRLFICFLITSYLAFAGDTAKLKTHTIGLEAGYGTNSFIDNYASSKLYVANCIPLDFQWLTEYRMHLEKFKVEVFTSSYSTFDREATLTDFYGFQSDLNYVYLINTFIKKNCLVYFGPGINFLYSYDSYKYLFFEDVIYNTVEILTSLELNSAARVKFQKDWLLLNAGISVIAYTGFLKYSLGSPFEGKIQVFPGYKSVSFEATYFYSLSNKFYIDLGYRFFYYSYPKFEKTEYLKRVNGQIKFGIDIKI